MKTLLTITLLLIGTNASALEGYFGHEAISPFTQQQLYNDYMKTTVNKNVNPNNNYNYQGYRRY